MTIVELHAGVISLAIEHRLAREHLTPMDGDAKDAMRVEVEAVLHEAAHAFLLFGRIDSSDAIAAALGDVSAVGLRDIEDHERSALRVSFQALKRLAPDESWTAIEDCAIADCGIEFDRTIVVSVAEHGVALWLERVVRASAARIRRRG